MSSLESRSGQSAVGAPRRGSASALHISRGWLAAVLLVATSVTNAAEPAAELVRTALRENPELAAERAKWAAAKQKAPQARSLPDPMFGVDVERDSTRVNSYMATEWMVSQRLPWFGKRQAQMTVAELEAEVVGFRYLEARRDLKANVIKAYLDLWLARQAVAVTAANQELLSKFEKIARARYESGQGMQADLLRAQVELARLSNELITAEREVPVMLNSLNRLLNAEPAAPRVADQPVVYPPMTLTLEQMQEQARQYCCILMSYLRAQQARDAAIRVAKLAGKPDFELRVEARQFDGRSGFQEFDTGVFINIPWLWRGKYKALVEEARAEKKMADAGLQAEVNMTLLEVREAYTAADTAQRLVALYQTDVLPKAVQLIEATRAGYEAGQATFLELIAAQQSWRDTQLALYRAQAAHGKSRAVLESLIAPWSADEFATGLVTPDMQ